jgi:glycerol dehydrogenase
MKQTAIFPGRYVQAAGALCDLGREVARLGRSALVIAGGTAHKTIVPHYASAWQEQFEWTAEPFGGECCDEEIERLAKVAGDRGCDVVVGMGGGKVIDTAKAVAHAAKAAVVVAPTIASTDAQPARSAHDAC